MPNDVNRIHEQVMNAYGDPIAEYARGSAEMEKSAIAALAMPKE